MKKPFSKVGGGAVLGTGSLCAKGVKYTVISTVRAGVVALRGSRLAYVGYRAAITTQTTCRVYKWGNDRLQKNMNDEGGGGGQGNNSGGGSRKLFNPKTDNCVIRTTRSGNKAIRITKEDGSILDVSPYRVKEYIPNKHPNAPSGALQRVKFSENTIPGTKEFKCFPVQEELDLLRNLTK